MKEKKINTYLQIKQWWHALPSHFAIDFLNLVKVPALFISSFRVFHRRLPLNERELSPYLFYKKSPNIWRIYLVSCLVNFSDEIS